MNTSEQAPSATPTNKTTPRTEGGVAPGKHGSTTADRNSPEELRRKKRAKEVTRAGEGGLEPGVHGVMPTHEDVHGLPGDNQQ